MEMAADDVAFELIRLIPPLHPPLLFLSLSLFSLPFAEAYRMSNTVLSLRPLYCQCFAHHRIHIEACTRNSELLEAYYMEMIMNTIALDAPRLSRCNFKWHVPLISICVWQYVCTRASRVIMIHLSDEIS